MKQYLLPAGRFVSAVAVRRNLNLLVCIMFLTPTLVMVPIFTAFLQTRGLNQTEIFASQVVYTAAALTTELPSGWFADRFGYKKSIATGVCLVLLGYIAYIPNLGLALILLAEVVIGVGFSFVSGADSSLAYASLASIGQADTYSEKYGKKVQIWINLAGIGFGTAGGLLVLIDMNVAVVVQVVVTMSALLFILPLQEPPRPESQPTTQPTSFKSALKDMKHVLVYALHGHPTLKWLIIFSALLSPTLQVAYWLTQPYLQAAHVPIWLFGFVNTFLLLAAVAFAFLIKRYESLGRKKALAGFVVVVAGSFIVLALKPAWWLLPALLGFYFVRATFFPMIEGYLHDEVSDGTFRASIVSVRRLAGGLVFIPLSLLTGFIADTFSLQAALTSIGVIWGVAGAFIIARMARLKLFAPA